MNTAILLYRVTIMKKNGFTLIELISVIAILALILIIAVPAVFKGRENALKGLSKEQERNIKEAALILALDIDDYSSDVFNCNSASWMNGKCTKDSNEKWVEATVTVAELKTHEYFEDRKGICSGTVTVAKDGSPYKVTLQEDIECE